MSSNLDLFRRNGLISKDGQVCGVLAPPQTDEVPRLQADLNVLIQEAQQRDVMLRLGILDDDGAPILVYAVDVGGPHDEHGFLRRLAAILSEHGVQPLKDDVSSDRVFRLADHLVMTSQAAWSP